MSTITTEDVLYFARTTNPDFGKGKATDLMLDLQEHPTFWEFMKKERVGFQSGSTIDGRAITDVNGSVREVGLYFQTEYQDEDGIETFSIPWAHVHGALTVETRLLKMNRDPAKILDIMDVKRAQLWAGFAKRFEEYFWELPQASANPKRPFGIPYCIVKNATLGFYGGNPAGFSAGTAGLSSVDFARWRNFSGTYESLSFDDGIDKWQRMIHLTNFMNPAALPQYTKAAAQRWMWAVNLNTKLLVERQARLQNDQNGFDVMSKDGKTTVNGNKLRYIPKLDEDTQNPIYGVDWNAIGFIFLEGEEWVETELEVLQNQPTTAKSDVTVTCNIRPVNRRRTGVLYQAA